MTPNSEITEVPERALAEVMHIRDLADAAVFNDRVMKFRVDDGVQKRDFTCAVITAVNDAGGYFEFVTAYGDKASVPARFVFDLRVDVDAETQRRFFWERAKPGIGD